MSDTFQASLITDVGGGMLSNDGEIGFVHFHTAESSFHVAIPREKMIALASVVGNLMPAPAAAGRDLGPALQASAWSINRAAGGDVVFGFQQEPKGGLLSFVVSRDTAEAMHARLAAALGKA